MKKSILAAVLLISGPAWAGNSIQSTTITAANQQRYTEGRRHAIVRRIVGAAACGLSMWDLAMTAKDVGHNGIVEGNGLLANPNGTAKLGAMSVLKIGICGGSLAIGELGARYHSEVLVNFGMVGSGGTAVVSAVTIFHNESILNKAKLMPGTLP